MAFRAGDLAAAEDSITEPDDWTEDTGTWVELRKRSHSTQRAGHYATTSGSLGVGR